MALNWESIPFAIGANNLLREELTTKLPFTIGCGTQQGLEHKEESFSNQDSLSVVIKENYFVGVVCDGCTSASSEFFNSISSNQVGANFISKTLSNVLNDFLKEKNVAELLNSVSEIESLLLEKIKSFANLLAKESSPTYRAEVVNSLMATIIAVVADENNYAIFNCGDGVVIVNDKAIDLENYQGQYISVQLLEPSNNGRNTLSVLSSGNTNELNSLFIASDGFAESSVLGSTSLKSFISERPKSISGFQKDFISSFRMGFINPFLETKDDYNSFPSDDATFILLRRIEVEEKIQPPPPPPPPSDEPNKDKKEIPIKEEKKETEKPVIQKQPVIPKGKIKQQNQIHSKKKKLSKKERKEKKKNQSRKNKRK